ncbi:MAG: hypothetical protein WCR27_03850, partial [Eubacteriales bacterium]
DIALGRDTSVFQCAVVKAILCGKSVYLLTEALEYRKFIKTANRNFYDMLTGYEKKIADYGVHIVSAEKLKNEAKIDQLSINDFSEAFDCTEKVITGAIAENLCKRNREKVILKKGAIVTPLAKDAFTNAKIQFNFV